MSDQTDELTALAASPEGRRRASRVGADLGAAMAINPVVHAANILTERWCAHLGGEDSVISAAGIWPLLALLASAADEPARAELTAALGRPADSAQRDALELLEILRAGNATAAALGIWAGEGVLLRKQWSSGLPDGVIGELSDQETLDRWASEATSGLINGFPLDINANTVLVIASALAARVRWCTPFDSHPLRDDRASDGSGRQWLSRTTFDVSDAAVLGATVIRVVVEGDDDLDVHLLLGDTQPADVLSAGLRELSGEAQVRLAADFDSGVGMPGLTVRLESSFTPDDELRLGLPSFEVATHHDLLARSELFGLRLLMDPHISHLPLLSPAQLFLQKGAQDVLARFYAEGFEAAAVSAFDMAVTGVPPAPGYEVTTVDVTFDRPFGFLVVHRTSRLAVAAGWVASPFPSAQERVPTRRLP